MVKIEDKRRKNAEKKKFKPDPSWAQAFLILLLHENAMMRQTISGEPESPELMIPLDVLRKFETLQTSNKTTLEYDEVAETVRITAPEAVMPKIIAPSKKIITKL